MCSANFYSTARTRFGFCPGHEGAGQFGGIEYSISCQFVQIFIDFLFSYVVYVEAPPSCELCAAFLVFGYCHSGIAKIALAGN